jgi:hypothetical protein
MAKVSQKELTEALCEVLSCYINDGASSEAVEPFKDLINRALKEQGETITFSDYYSMRDRPSAKKRAKLKEFGRRYLSEYFGAETFYGGPAGGRMKD